MMNDATAEQSTQPSCETEAADIGGRSAVTLPLSARKYNTAAIRELLTQAMDDDDFTAFCFDYFPKVYELFSTGLKRLLKIQMLLDYCMRQEQYPYLLDLLRQKNPNKYARFASQLDIPPRELTTGDRQLLTVPINYELMRLEFAADVSRTTPEQMEMVKKAITGMLSYTLGVDPNHVHFLRAHPGSLIADVLLPTDAAQRLMALTERDQSLKDEMGLLRVEPQGQNLAKANLEGIVLAGVIMSEANFSYANLRGAVLRDAILNKANFAGAKLSGANLERTVLTEANMSKADLRGSLLRGAVLAQANLSDADLSNAQLQGAVLTQANLAGANLRGTVLDNDTLRPTGATEAANQAQPSPDAPSPQPASSDDPAEAFRKPVIKAEARVAQTGQKQCWNASGALIDCAGTGQDGAIRAGVPWPTPRFTDNGNGTVTDNLTGLIWLKDADGFGEVTWEDALTYARNLASGNRGLTDGSRAGAWRLPTIRELFSLIDYGTANPTIPAGHPFTNVRSSIYWTSTTLAAAPTLAWMMTLGIAPTVFDLKINANRMWPVRHSETTGVARTGQQKCWNARGEEIPCASTGQDGEIQAGVAWPTPRFTDNGDGTVTDNLTKLVWLKNADPFGWRTWEQALRDCNELASGRYGLTDGSVANEWRLPNIREIESLVDYNNVGPCLPTGHPFVNVRPSSYWTSTSVAAAPTQAMFIILGVGPSIFESKEHPFFVWPVRDLRPAR